MQSPFSVWLFCRVVDNFGDAGVCWRLAQALHQELGWHISLVIDDDATLHALVPDVVATDTAFPMQTVHGVALYPWHPENTALWTKLPAPDLVIEAFACELPDAVKALIGRHRPLWINLEYLSAETWTQKSHLLPSPQPNGVVKTFYFPGFTPDSGGLIRERDLETAMPITGTDPSAPPWRWFVFGYAAPVWTRWAQTWQRLPVASETSTPCAPLWASFNAAGGLPESDGESHWRAHLIPFVPQSEFDALLSRFDALVVRGEDSLTRAIFSAKPFLWQLYPQHDHAHWPKAQAFWDLAYAYFPEKLRHAHERLSAELNGVTVLDEPERAGAWQTLWEMRQDWQTAAAAWRQALLAQPGLVQKLAEWVQTQV